MNLKLETCDICYGECAADQLTEVDGQELCPSCLEAHNVVCRECGERILREDNAGTDAQPLYQGDGRRNYNNHPFQARAGGTAFALAHNGMIHNDRMLRRSLKLPRTKIETDSYVAVQLIQRRNALDFDSLKYMAEQVEGSFSFTVLDDRDLLYFVKGDSPLCICHYPGLGLYLYASTAEILMDALIHIPYHLGEWEQVNIDSGELLMIGPDGSQQRASFEFSDPMSFYGLGYWELGCCPTYRNSREEYTRALKSVAGAFGISPGQIDRLLAEGFTHKEIEGCLYCGGI